MAASRLLLFTAFSLVLIPWVAGALAGETTSELTATQERIIDLGRNDNRAMEHLDILVNRYGPRLTASDNNTNACEWAVERFKSFGIENARLDEAGTFPVGFNRGPWFGRMVEPEEMHLTFGTSAWSAGTKGTVRGPAVLPPLDEADLEEAKKNPEKYANAWVFSQRSARRRGGGQNSVASRISEFLRDAGIAGYVRATRGQSVTTGGNRNISWDNLPKTPSINLIRNQFEAIRERIDKGERVILEFDIRNHFVKGPVKYYNVIADITGTEFPDEYVIIGGHIDSWDGATGTTDNGTGVATTMEAARLLMAAGAKPRRTIRFMLWSGEEQGLLGSRAYIEKNRDLVAKISGVFVHDGGTNYLSGVDATEHMAKDFEQVFAPVMNLNPEFPFKINERKGLRVGIGSDHDSFLRAGVPGFFWHQDGRAVYNRTWHTHLDTYDAAIPEYQEHSSMVAALGALGIANLDHLLSREEMRAPERRRMGVFLDGTKVQRVVENSVAGNAGLKKDDIVLSVDGEKVTGQRQLSNMIQKGDPKKTFRVKRGDKELDLIFEWPGAKKEEKKKVEIL